MCISHDGSNPCFFAGRLNATVETKSPDPDVCCLHNPLVHMLAEDARPWLWFITSLTIPNNSFVRCNFCMGYSNVVACPQCWGLRWVDIIYRSATIYLQTTWPKDFKHQVNSYQIKRWNTCLTSFAYSGPNHSNRMRNTGSLMPANKSWRKASKGKNYFYKREEQSFRELH